MDKTFNWATQQEAHQEIQGRPYPTIFLRVISKRVKNDFRTIMDKMEIQKYTSLKAKANKSEWQKKNQ